MKILTGSALLLLLWLSLAGAGGEQRENPIDIIYASDIAASVEPCG